MDVDDICFTIITHYHQFKTHIKLLIVKLEVSYAYWNVYKAKQLFLCFPLRRHFHGQSQHSSRVKHSESLTHEIACVWFLQI